MITLTDIFAGAGGSTTGAINVPGVHVVMAANHSQLAVNVHQENHQQTTHACVDLHMEDPRNFPRTDILWASPECFAAGTLVSTQRGLVPIEDVVVGDLVLTHKGRYRPVTDTMSREAETVVARGQGNSAGITTTADHPFLVAPDHDFVKIADAVGKRWATPTEYPAADVPPIGGRSPIHVDDERFAWLVGRWIGDGSLRVRPNGSDETFITCGKHEVDELEPLLSWKHHDCDVCAPELIWSRRELRTAYVFANSNGALARWLVEHFGQHAHGKTIPMWVMGAPRAWREALLAGYLSADGHDNGRGWQASSVSQLLALGIRLLAESLGHRVSLTYHARDTWRIEGRTGRARPQWTVTWLHTFKRESEQTAFEGDGMSWGTIKSVEPTGTVETVWDLTVEEDHSFVADGIVVHNCTKWSIANSKAKELSLSMGGDPTLFDDVPVELESSDEDEITRSRLLMFDVLRFVEHHKYRAVIVENVVDIAMQQKYRAAWNAWQRGLRRLGYAYRIVSLNSMHAQLAGLPAPQSRDRLYIVAWPEGERAPDIDRVLSPQAWCSRCGTDVRAQQAWKQLRTVGRYRAQYIYACPQYGHQVEPGWLPASTAIDWTIPAERIADRKRPLSDKTMARIREGLRRYGSPWILDNNHNNHGAHASMPLPTQTTATTKGLVIEAAGNTYDMASGSGNRYLRAWPTTDPLRTLHGTTSKGIVFDAIRSAPIINTTTEPLRAQTTACTRGLLLPRRDSSSSTHHNDRGLLVPYYSSSDSAKPTTYPVGTLTCVDRYGLVTLRNHGGVTPVTDPIATVTASGNHHGLLDVTDDDIMACHFRMLEPHEIAAGMSFPLDYKWQGTKRDRVRLAGNAVTPPAARDLVMVVVESILDGPV